MPDLVKLQRKHFFAAILKVWPKYRVVEFYNIFGFWFSKIKDLVGIFGSSMSLELQQRSVEFAELFKRDNIRYIIFALPNSRRLAFLQKKLYVVVL